MKYNNLYIESYVTSCKGCSLSEKEIIKTLVNSIETSLFKHKILKDVCEAST